MESFGSLPAPLSVLCRNQLASTSDGSGNYPVQLSDDLRLRATPATILRSVLWGPIVIQATRDDNHTSSVLSLYEYAVRARRARVVKRALLDSRRDFQS